MPSVNAGLSPDTDFRAPFFATPRLPQRALLLPDGKYLLFFDPETLTNQPTGAVTRFLPDGTLDTSFNFSRLYKYVGAAVSAGNGKIYVSAVPYAYGTKEAEQVLRLNNDGSIDTSFTPVTVGGPNTFPDVRQILVQPDGKVLVAGFFSTFSGAARDNIVRLLADGTMDSTFVGPTFGNGDVWCVALQPDGKILVGGTFIDVNGVAAAVSRLNTNGSVDSSFQAAGFTREAPIRALVIQSDAKIVISCRFRSGSGSSVTRAPVVRVNSDGNLDPTFNSFSTSTVATGRDLLLQSDGKIIAAVSNSVYRFNTNGSRDTTFRQPVMFDSTLNPPTGGAGTPVTIQFEPDGDILVGGIFTDVDPPGAPTNSHFGVARLNADGTLDPSLVTSRKTALETAPSSFARLSDGSTLVGFGDRIEPLLPYNVGRLLSDGSLDPNFTLSSSNPNSFLSGGFLAEGFEPLPDGKFFVFGWKAGTAGFTYGKVAPSGGRIPDSRQTPYRSSRMRPLPRTAKCCSPPTATLEPPSLTLSRVSKRTGT